MKTPRIEPPASIIADAGTASSDDSEKPFLDEKLEGLRQDRQQRKEYAGKIFYLVCAWLGVLALAMLLTGFRCMALSDAVLIALTGGATISIIGLMVIVANYLFPKIK